MREIKFRAWTGSKMHSASILRNMGGLALADGLSSKDLLVVPTPKYEVMQYTGLKDKDGVEIYEGDILSCGNLNYKLTWEDGKACEIYNKEDKFSPRFLFNYIDQLEVIGNIYENKELLDER